MISLCCVAVPYIVQLQGKCTQITLPCTLFPRKNDKTVGNTAGGLVCRLRKTCMCSITFVTETAISQVQARQSNSMQDSAAHMKH